MALKRHRAGTEVYIQAQVYNNLVTPAVLYDPATDVRLTLVNPAGTTVLNNVAMTRGTLGRYGYRWQSSTSDPTGIWSAAVKSTDGSSVVLTEIEAAFQLVP